MQAGGFLPDAEAPVAAQEAEFIDGMAS